MDSLSLHRNKEILINLVLAIVIILFIIFTINSISAASYYVNATTGNDANDGLSPANPFKTIAKINAKTYSPGDNIYLERGSMWRERLYLYNSSGNSSDKITIQDYGDSSKAKPLLLASENRTTDTKINFTDQGSNLWKSQSFNASGAAFNIAFILLKSETASPVWGTDVAKFETDKVDLDAEGDMWWDPYPNSSIWLYTTNASGPNLKWAGMEVAERDRGLLLEGVHHIDVKNIDARYGNGGSFRIGEKNFTTYVNKSFEITLDSVEASWGGGTITSISSIRAGDIIKVDTGSYNITVKNSNSSYSWEACFSVETWDKNGLSYNVKFDNNTAYKCGLGFGINTPQYGNNTRMYNISVTNNKIIQSGKGWSPPTQASHGTGIWCYEAAVNAGNLTEITIENNTIDVFTANGIYVMNGGPYTIRGNIVTGGTGEYSTDPYPGAIVIHGGGTDQSIGEVWGEVYNNLVYNNIRGLYLINNNHLSKNISFYNNVFYNNSNDTWANIHIASNTAKIRFFNNIFYSLLHTIYKTPASTGIYDANYNLYYWATGYLISYGATNTSNATLYKNTLDVDANSLFNVSVGFTNLSNYTFTLNATSPAKDAGTNVGITRDILGKVVPNPDTSLYDIGAYERYDADTTYPSIFYASSNSLNNTFSNSILVFNVTGNETYLETAWLEVIVNSAEPVNVTGAFTCTGTTNYVCTFVADISDGTNDGNVDDYRVWVNDTSGNSNVTGWRRATIDNTPPNCTLLSRSPTNIVDNSTGNLNVIINCSDINGINVTKPGDHYPFFITRTVDAYILASGIPNYWSNRYPNNSLSVVGSLTPQYKIWRALGRNEAYWYENLTNSSLRDCTGLSPCFAPLNDTFSYAIEDGEYGHFSIINTSTDYHINYTHSNIDIAAFRQSVYLSYESMVRESKKNQTISATSYVLMKRFDAEAYRGTKNYTMNSFRNFGVIGTPTKTLRAFYCNSSYSPTGTTRVIDSPNCAFINSLTATEINNRIYTDTNSTYSKGTYGIINGKFSGIVATTEFYIEYETPQTSAAAYYQIRYVNGSTNTDVKFNDTKVAWTSSNEGVTWTQAAWTPDVFTTTTRATDDTFQFGIYVSDPAGNVYSNFTLFSDDITTTNHPISFPLILEYNSSSSKMDDDLNGTHKGLMNIYIGISTDPDSVGNVTHNLTLTNLDGTWNYTINTSFKSTSDTDLWIPFDTTSVKDGKYRMNIFAQSGDNNLDVKNRTTDRNFTIDNTLPALNITYPINNTNFTKNTLDINFTVSDTNLFNCWYSNTSGLTNTTLTNCYSNLTGKTWAQGTNKLIIYANDTAGNINSSSVSFYIDSNPPSFTLIPSNSTLTYLSDSLSVVFAGTDALSSINYTINWSNNFTIGSSSGLLQNSSSLGQGIYYINVTITDTLNNMASLTYRVNVSNYTSPVTPPSGGGGGLTPVVNITVTNQSLSSGELFSVFGIDLTELKNKFNSFMDGLTVPDNLKPLIKFIKDYILFILIGILGIIVYFTNKKKHYLF